MAGTMEKLFLILINSMRKFIILFLSISSILAQENELLESFKLEVVNEDETLNHLGLKWGMNMNEVEGYIKDIKLRGEEQIVANGINLGRKSEFILQFENNMLATISVISVISGEKSERFNNANKSYYILFNWINQILSPDNRKIDFTRRDFEQSVFLMQDRWAYNEGKSTFSLKTQYISDYDDLYNIQIYSGDLNSSVFVFSQESIDKQMFVSKNIPSIFKR